MDEVTHREWKVFLERHPDAHILQSAEWGELKSRFGWSTNRFILDEEVGAQILIRRLPLGLSLAYLPKPVFSERVLLGNEQLWERLDAHCRAQHAIFLKVELDSWQQFSPTGDEDHKMKVSPHNIQPPRTILVSLQGTEKELLARMKQKTRYNIRLAARKDVTVRPWDDLPAFHRMMRETGERDGFGVHSLAYYQRAYELFHPVGMVELLVAEYQGHPLAALMVFASGRRSWYMYGASTDEQRNRMPTYLLQWEAMCWARTRGAEVYDLWGVPDEDPQTLEAQFTQRREGLWGVYRFKRGFGGQVKRAAQALDRVYNPVLYQLYLWFMAGREGA